MPAPDPMACNELVELVTEYLEDTLPPAERLRLERHLSGCEGCQAYVEQMRQTIEATARLDPESIPAEGLERLLEVYRAYRNS